MDNKEILRFMEMVGTTFPGFEYTESQSLKQEVYKDFDGCSMKSFLSWMTGPNSFQLQGFKIFI